MRISDWSSDVCSADLRRLPAPRLRGHHHRHPRLPRPRPAAARSGLGRHGFRDPCVCHDVAAHGDLSLHRDLFAGARLQPAGRRPARSVVARLRENVMAGPKESYSGPILECRNLCLSYFTRAGEIPAVIDFNMTLNQGESRSEEHTSELQSLMRISYAVFCLKKKKDKINT